MSGHQKLPGRASLSATPRWVKILAAIFMLLALLFVVLHLMGFGFGGHGVSSAWEGTAIGIGLSRV